MIEENYSRITEQMAEFSSRYGVACPQLLAVSKKKPVADIRTLYALGQRSFGESYAQEAAEKISALQELEIVWHFIGPLQSNKTRLVAAHFDWVQSVDREKILQRLNQHRPEDKKPLQLLLQMKIGDVDSKSGADEATLLRLLQQAAQLDRVQVRGLMCIPPPAETFEQQRAYFAQARDWFDLHRKDFALDTLSMGMSNDFEAAIACGSSMIRVGTDLFGAR